MHAKCGTGLAACLGTSSTVAPGGAGGWCPQASVRACMCCASQGHWVPQGPRQHPLTPGSLQCCPSQTAPQACTSLIKMPKYDKAWSAWLPPLTVCSWPRGTSWEGRWMRNHTPGPTVCYRAVLAQGLAHPGRSGGFLRARTSPNGAKQRSHNSTDTQQLVSMGPRPGSLNGSWAAALVSSPKITSHPTAGVSCLASSPILHP